MSAFEYAEAFSLGDYCADRLIGKAKARMHYLSCLYLGTLIPHIFHLSGEENSWRDLRPKYYEASIILFILETLLKRQYLPEDEWRGLNLTMYCIPTLQHGRTPTKLSSP